MMIRRVVLACLLLTFLALLLAAFSGCSTTPRRRGIKLSDATEEAKKKPEEQRTLREGEADEEMQVRTRTPRDADEEVDSSLENLNALTEDESGDDLSTAAAAGSAVAAGVIAASTVASAEDEGGAKAETKEKERQHVMFGIYGIELAGDALQDYHGYLFEYGQYLMPRLRLVGGLYVANLHRGSARDIQASIRNPKEVGLDVSARFYLTPDKTFMGLYGLGGIRWGLFSWKYANPITVTNDDGDEETIESDTVQVVHLYTGLGLSVVQTRGFHLGANLSAGFWAPKATTWEGFDNDIFEQVGYFQLMIEGSVFF